MLPVFVDGLNYSQATIFGINLAFVDAFMEFGIVGFTPSMVTLYHFVCGIVAQVAR